MKSKIFITSFFRKDLNLWEYPESIFVLLLFFPSKREERTAMTDLERLGIWAAWKAREEIKKSTEIANASRRVESAAIDDMQEN